MTEGYLRNPIELIVGGRSTIPKSVEVTVEVLPETEKFNRLMEILSDFYKDDTDARTLVFVEQQKSADDLLNRIMKSGMGIPCNSIYGSKPQDERIDAIAGIDIQPPLRRQVGERHRVIASAGVY